MRSCVKARQLPAKHRTFWHARVDESRAAQFVRQSGIHHREWNGPMGAAGTDPEMDAGLIAPRHPRGVCSCESTVARQMEGEVLLAAYFVAICRESRDETGRYRACGTRSVASTLVCIVREPLRF